MDDLEEPDEVRVPAGVVEDGGFVVWFPGSVADLWEEREFEVLCMTLRACRWTGRNAFAVGSRAFQVGKVKDMFK